MILNTFLKVSVASLLAAGIVYAGQEKSSAPTAEPATPEAIKQFNDDSVAALSKQIAGKEDQPAETVFKNLQLLNKVPAGRLLAIMQMGYSRSLGVSCAHCHVPGEWQKDDKQPKQITRDMAAMSKTINQDLLKNIAGLKDRTPIVNCTTCHRGQLKPALNIDDAPKN
jgi:cytochrome c peroxidase